MTDAVVSFSSGKSEVITVRLEREISNRVARAANADDRTVSAWVRLAVLEKLGREEGG